MICALVIGTSDVFAATTSFSGSATANGGGFISLEDTQGGSYLKVVINTTNGDNYDLKYIYSTDWISSRKTIAQKKGLKAKGTTSTIYFVPTGVSCPGSSSQCVTVPVISGITSSTQAGTGNAFYGIEIYNGSLLGGTLKVSGTYSFL